MKSRKKSSPKSHWFKYFIQSGIMLLQVYLFVIILFRVVPVPFSPLMLLRDAPINKDWVSIKNISPNVIKAAITSEDPKFLSHFGFDFENIQQAIQDRVEKDKKLRGGSTITQQTAKNLMLWPARSWLRKGLEVPITLTLELFWSKRRIMEVYLNIIEMGNGIYGIEAAAQHYFNKPAIALNTQQAALIVACFPNPRYWLPNKPSSFIRKKQRTIIRWMRYVPDVPNSWIKTEK